MGKLDQARKALEDALRVPRDLAAKAETEGRDFTAEERETVVKAMEDAKTLRASFETAKADNAMMADIKALGLDLGLANDGKGEILAEADVDTGLIVPGRDRKSIGEQFLNSPQFKALIGQYPGGRVPEKARVESAPIGIKGLAQGQKALVTGGSGTSAGALVDPDLLGLRDAGGVFMRPLVIRDLLSTGTTESDAVEYARVTGFTNAAAPVAESTATADPGSMTPANGVKPESSLTLATVTEPVKTIAHWIPATKRALSDAGQIRMLIDQFLLYGLDEELEDQVMAGDGVGQNFTGLLNVSGTTAQAFDTNILTTTRKARTKVRTVGRATPTAYVLNPLDWEKIDLLQDNEARYIFGGPQALGQPRLWGLPVVESEAIPANTAMVGDFRQAFLLDREQSSITVSDSHANFFIRNMVAILAELRAVFGVFRPAAFVEIALV